MFFLYVTDVFLFSFTEHITFVKEYVLRVGQRSKRIQVVRWIRFYATADDNRYNVSV